MERANRFSDGGTDRDATTSGRALTVASILLVVSYYDMTRRTYLEAESLFVIPL